VPLVTSDFPMKVAPSSITRRAAFNITLQSAARLELAAFTHRDVALNFSITVMDLVLISPRMSAFSPMVRTPSELISPPPSRLSGVPSET